MATQVKHRRGNTAEIEAFTPAVGELIVNTDNSTIVVGDGVKQGGHKVPKASNIYGANFKLLQSAKVSQDISVIFDGAIIRIGDRADHLFDVVTLASLGGGVLNGFDEINLTGLPLLALKLREGVDTDVKAFGATGDNSTDDTEALEYAFSIGRVIRVSRGAYKFNRTLHISKYTSVECVVGANLIADFSNSSTWSSDFVALRFEGLGGQDVTVNDFNTTFKDVVLTSISASTVEAIGVEVPNGATSSSILEARTFCEWDNVMVIGFDTAYRLGQLRESVLTNIKCRDVRVGIDVNGKSVNVALNSLNLFRGTPQTTNTNPSKGFIVDSFFREAVEERPEGIVVSCGSLIAAFDVNIQYVRGLSISVVDSIIDLAQGNASVQIGPCRGFTLHNNWIASIVANPVIVLDTIGVPADEVLCQITNNTINGGTNGISFGTNRRSMLIQGNEFASQSGIAILLSNATDIDVLNNKGKDQSSAFINITSCGDLNIDGNTTDADIVINMHPTANTKGGINIGKNYGAVQRTWSIGVAKIEAGLTSVAIISPLDVTNYVIPVVNVNYIESTSNTTLVGTSSYNSPNSAITLVSSVPAPAGGHNIHYELKGLWYGDRS